MSTRTHGNIRRNGNIRRSKQNGKSYFVPTEELREAIIEAHFKIKKTEEKLMKKETEDWEREVGIIKEIHSKSGQGIFKVFFKIKEFLKNVSNGVHNLWIVVRLKEEQIREGTASVPLMSAVLSSSFFMISCAFWILTFLAVVLSFIAFSTKETWIVGVLGILVIIVSPPLAGLTNIVSKEISKTTDKQYLAAFSSWLFSLIALIVAAISFLYRK